jgi:hypothetical protein
MAVKIQVDDATGARAGMELEGLVEGIGGSADEGFGVVANLGGGGRTMVTDVEWLASAIEVEAVVSTTGRTKLALGDIGQLGRDSLLCRSGIATALGGRRSSLGQGFEGREQEGEQGSQQT